MSKNHLVWIDLEMSGLDVSKDKILEIAVLITDEDLVIQAELQSLAIYQTADILDAMDDWNKNTHSSSGLISRVRDSKINENLAEQVVLDFLLKNSITPNSSPLCGNSIYNDRKFISKYMSKLDNFLHYRLIDVSSIKELAIRWYGLKFEKQTKHTALADIRESIAELSFYRDKIFKSS